MPRSHAVSKSSTRPDSLAVMISRRLNTQPRAMLGVVALAAVTACEEPERTFGDAVTVPLDAGDAGTSRVVDASPANSTTPAGSETPEAGGTASETFTSTNQPPDAGSSCEPAVCPENTECRSYHPGNCEPTGESGCEVVNVQATTPCDSGNGACDGSGECVVPNLATLGSTCERDDQCGSHHCAATSSGERVCCDTTCDGVCTTCSADGHCDTTPANDAACGERSCAPSSTCVTYPPDVDAASCVGFGQCETEEAHCAPQYTPADESCGEGLVCDGRGSCVLDCPDPGPDRTCTEECPCEAGQGTCTSSDQCADGFVCTQDAIAKLGFPDASCLPAHCVNNKHDEEETSVDCGGGCGCRATYEVISISGVPEGAGFGLLSAMSGDGSAFAANIGRDDGGRFTPSYPVRVDAKGVVTELEGFGVSGNAFGINADGTVIVGDLWCDNPPDCTSAEFYRPMRWTNSDAPVAVFRAGSGRLVSASGAVVAGTSFDPDLGLDLAFRASTNRHIDIPELDYVVGLSADGEYLAGRSSTGDVGALWSNTLEGLVELTPPSEWLSWGIDALSDDGRVFVGSGRVDNTNVQPAYMWKDGTFSTLPKLPGADYNNVGAISANGSVVVGLSGTNAVQRAFIWDETKGIRTVLAETVARGLELPVDLELTTVDFLSDDGTILVGWVYGTEVRSFWRVTLLP